MTGLFGLGSGLNLEMLEFLYYRVFRDIGALKSSYDFIH